jgi:hypothetical protein
MLQTFQIDVAKVDHGVTYVDMVVHVSSVCSKCFIWFKLMLQVFYLDVAKVDLDVFFDKVDLDVTYICMLQAYVLSVLRCFICMCASVSSECCICLQ